MLESQVVIEEINLAKNQITISNITSKNSFSISELKQCSEGILFEPGNAQLPTPPLLMLDRIVDIQATGGAYGRGYALAELEIDPSRWFFKHHFQGDPVMPGCFLIESLWQLTGFHLAWSGYKGRGRVLESGRTRFVVPVKESNQILSIEIQVRKVFSRNNPICIANGEIIVNNEIICHSDAIKIGLFIDSNCL
jgi:3-hydroxyacyl-[acyl-carrier protein] dehydratase/trans-2-decenoyl-[acyl-carrier protein] isomerase